MKRWRDEVVKSCKLCELVNRRKEENFLHSVSQNRKQYTPDTYPSRTPDAGSPQEA